MRRKKNRNRIKNKQSSQLPKADEYDLKSSLKRLHQRSENSGGETISYFDANEKSGQTINSESIVPQQESTTALFLLINDSINSRYDKLKDDITIVSDKIGNSIKNLRIEIDKKLEKKVNLVLFNKLFYGAISVIVTMAIIIYIFSYSGLLKNTNTNKEKIDSVTLEQKTLNKNIKSVEKKLFDLQEKQNELEKSFKRNKLSPTKNIVHLEDSAKNKDDSNK